MIVCTVILVGWLHQEMPKNLIPLTLRSRICKNIHTSTEICYRFHFMMALLHNIKQTEKWINGKLYQIAVFTWSKVSVTHAGKDWCFRGGAAPTPEGCPLPRLSIITFFPLLLLFGCSWLLKTILPVRFRLENILFKWENQLAI